MVLSDHWGAFCFGGKYDPERRNIVYDPLNLNVKCDPLDLSVKCDSSGLSLILKEKNILRACTHTHTGCVCMKFLGRHKSRIDRACKYGINGKRGRVLVF